MTTEDIKREIAFEKSEMMKEKITTAVKKAKFVNEIKLGLGDAIKNNPRGVKIIKKPWYIKLNQWVKSLFTKF